MKCSHCCFACTTRGTDMTHEVFRAALKLNDEYGQYPALGGGEPTLHPHFWEFLGLSLTTDADSPPLIVTNGKIPETAIALARLGRRGVIHAVLSQDQWHESIEPEVVEAFAHRLEHTHTFYGERSGPEDLREIRNVGTNLVSAGRAKKFAYSKKECCCDELTCDPDGSLWACGCRAEKFGTVLKPAIPEDYFQRDNVCSRRLKR